MMIIEWEELNIGGGEVQSKTGNDIVAYCCTCCSRALDYLNDHDATIVTDDDGDATQSFRRHTLLGGGPAGAREGLRGRESSGAATALIASVHKPSKLFKWNMSMWNTDILIEKLITHTPYTHTYLYILYITKTLVQ